MITFKSSAAQQPRSLKPLPDGTKRKRLLVTGAENSLAKYLALGLRDNGYEVAVQVVQEDSYFALKQTLPAFNLSLIDHRFAEAMASFSPDVVLHASAEPAQNSISRSPIATYNRIVDKTVALCEAVRRHTPTAKLILLSSAAVYGQCEEHASEERELAPVSREGRFHAIAEEVAAEFANAHELKLNTLRVFSAYGPGLRCNPVYDLVMKILGPKSRAIIADYPATARRDLIHAGDVLSAVHCILSGHVEGAINIASGQSLSMQEIATHLCNLTEQSLPQFPAEMPYSEAECEQANVSKLRALGFTPQVPLIEGLRGFVSWWSGVKAA